VTVVVAVAVSRQ